jgi:hypothetical protein
MKQDGDGPQTVTVHVPIKFNLRGGRKMIISEYIPPASLRKTDNALVKALARAHRWRRMIENGEYACITELARAECTNQSYACRILRLTLLAPALVTDILNGHQDPDLTLDKLARPLPVRWDEQLDAIAAAVKERKLADLTA